MNPALDPIFARRSVRKYEPDAIDDSEVRDLLEAAMAAPSAVVKDPWDFIVVRDRVSLARIADALPNGKMLAEAALGIVVCGDPRRAHDQQLSYLLQDCSAAIENLLLAATALGLGTCWLGVHPRENRMTQLRELLNIPEEILPVAVIALGHPAEFPKPRTRYRDNAVHHETW